MAEFDELVDRGVEPRAAAEVAALRDEAVARFARGMGLPATLLNCPTSQCRVETFVPGVSGRLADRCPACYGVGA